MQNPNPPKHFVRKEDYESVLEAWQSLAEGRNFELLKEKNKNGDYYLSSQPFKVEAHEEPDNEIWMATITVDLESPEFAEDDFIRDYYRKPVKEAIEGVKESVVLLSYPKDGRTKFMLHASAVIQGGVADRKPTSRIQAAIDGFKVQLKKWLSKDRSNDLCDEAERCLIAAINGVR